MYKQVAQSVLESSHETFLLHAYVIGFDLG